MMKKILLLVTIIFGLTACGSTNNTSPLVTDSTKPILNIESSLAPLIEADVSSSQAWIKNKSDDFLTLAYTFFWYNKNGVTEGNDLDSEKSTLITLEKHQQVKLPLVPPTKNSVNYRLYLRLK